MPFEGDFNGYQGYRNKDTIDVWTADQYQNLTSECRGLKIWSLRVYSAADYSQVSHLALDVPGLVSRFPNLEVLELPGRHTTPAELQAISALSGLRRLRLQQFEDGRVISLRPLRSHQSLRSLDISATVALFDECMEEVGRLGSLEELSVSLIEDNREHPQGHRHDKETVDRLGRSFRHLRTLKQLRVLDLQAEQFGDAAIEAIGGEGGLVRLEALNIVGSSVTKNGIATLARKSPGRDGSQPWLPGLRELHVDDRMTDNQGLAGLSTLPGLARLSLHGYSDGGLYGEFNERGFAHLGAMPDLEALALRGCNRIGGAGIAHLQSAPRLREIIIHECPGIADEAVKAMAGIPSLRRCVLADRGHGRWSSGAYDFESIGATAILAFSGTGLEELRLPWSSPLRPPKYTEKSMRELQAGTPALRIRTLDGQPSLQFARIALVHVGTKPCEDSTVVIVSESDGTVAAIAQEEVVTGIHLEEYMGPMVDTVPKADRWKREEVVPEKTVYDTGILPVGRYVALAFAEGMHVGRTDTFEIQAEQRTDISLSLVPSSISLWEQRTGEPLFARTGPGATRARERSWKYWNTPPEDSLYRVVLKPWVDFRSIGDWTAVVCTATEAGATVSKTWKLNIDQPKHDGVLHGPGYDVGLTPDRTPPVGDYFVRIFVKGKPPAVAPLSITGDPKKDSSIVVCELK